MKFTDLPMPVNRGALDELRHEAAHAISKASIGRAHGDASIATSLKAFFDYCSARCAEMIGGS